MILSFFESEKDNQPIHAEVTWQELVDELSRVTPAACTLATCEGKDCHHKRGRAWSPTRYYDDTTRAVQNAESVAFLLYDVDHVKTDDELAAIYERVSQWQHFVHSTHSDRPGDRFVRIGLNTNREILPREFAPVRRAVQEMLELPGDPRTNDIARLAYINTRPSDACGDAIDGSGYLCAAHGDKVLDVDAILATLAASDDGVEYTPTEFVVPDFEGAPSQEKLEEAARVIADAWPDDDRHRAQLALAGALARAGWPVGLIASFCARVAEIDQPGNPKHVRLAAPSARASVEKVREGRNVEGWPTVIEYVGEVAVKQAKALLGLDVKVNEGLFEMFAGRIAAHRQERQDVLERIERGPAEPAPPPIVTGEVTVSKDYLNELRFTYGSIWRDSGVTRG